MLGALLRHLLEAKPLRGPGTGWKRVQGTGTPGPLACDCCPLRVSPSLRLKFHCSAKTELDQWFLNSTNQPHRHTHTHRTMETERKRDPRLHKQGAVVYISQGFEPQLLSIGIRTGI